MHYKSSSKTIFGIMNEPHDISDLPGWATSVQAAVTAIRQAGATSQNILILGSTYAHASTLPTEAGPSLLKVKDTDGSVNKLIFDVRQVRYSESPFAMCSYLQQYLDSDDSGTHTTCTTDNTAVFSTVYQWLTTNNRQALHSETVSVNKYDLYCNPSYFPLRAGAMTHLATLISELSSRTSRRTRTVSLATPCGLRVRSIPRTSSA